MPFDTLRSEKGNTHMDETNNIDFSNYDEDYDAKLQQEIEVRRMRRKQIAKHRVKITRCNYLILGEIITLVVLILALVIISTR